MSTIQIPLTNGKYALIDEDDYDLVCGFRWRCNGGNQRGYYAYTGGHEEPGLFMHRLILDVPAGFVIDHINGDGLDNRRSNLRLATISENGGNQQLSSRSKSGYKGVSWKSQIGKWQAQIKFQYRTYYLGVFECREDAARAYDRKARELFGPFAKVNGVDAG